MHSEPIQGYPAANTNVPARHNTEALPLSFSRALCPLGTQLIRLMTPRPMGIHP